MFVRMRIQGFLPIGTPRLFFWFHFKSNGCCCSKKASIISARRCNSVRQIVTECNNTCSGFSPPNIIHVVPQLYTIEKNSRIPPLSTVLPIIMFLYILYPGGRFSTLCAHHFGSPITHEETRLVRYYSFFLYSHIHTVGKYVF